LKIAQVVYTGFGGLGSVAFSLVDADVDRRHQWIIGFIGNVPIDVAYPVRCVASKVGWEEFRSTGGRPFRAWLALTRWLAQERPDAVILHSINSILPCRLCAWWRGVLLIAVEHTPNGVKTRSEWAFSRLAMVLADRVVLLTPEYQDELARAHGWLFRPSKVSIIANGIDTALFRPSVRSMGESARVRLGMAARFSLSKGQELLVEMITILKKKRPAIKWELSLAGSGEKFDSVKILISMLGLEDEVLLEGVLDEPSVSRWLQGLDLYVRASHGETLSTSLLQAMATGRLSTERSPNIRRVGTCAVGRWSPERPSRPTRPPGGGGKI
jgi:glycosyltransferase involved in cell wall biosynthesis